MQPDGWWKSDIPHELDQGDIFIGVPMLLPETPTQNLAKAQVRGGDHGYVALDPTKVLKTPSNLFLAKGRFMFGLLLNHGCDIDKPNNRRLLFCAVSNFEAMDEAQKQNVVTQKSRTMLFLPDVPTFGDLYADLRIISTLDRTTANSLKRVASMTSDAQDRLQTQIVEFFLRRQI